MANNQKTKNVRLDNDVMKTLAKARQGFESPNDCLKRLLSCGCVQDELKKQQDKQEPDQQLEQEAVVEE